MTRRAEFASLPSEFGEFLFANVGAEGELTVFSAMTRLDIDPIVEAARLAAMPADLAIEALAAVLRRVPQLEWKETDFPAAAARLVALLPAAPVGSRSSEAPVTQRRPDIPLNRVFSLFLAVVFGSVLLLGWLLSRPNVLEP
jgi:uncharacterized membrane protein YfcA